MKPEDIARQYDEAIESAARSWRDVQNRYNNAIQRLGEVSPTITEQPAEFATTPPRTIENPEYKQRADQVRELERSLSEASQQHTILLRQKAEAQSKAAMDANVSPEMKAKLEADAKHSLAQAE